MNDTPKSLMSVLEPMPDYHVDSGLTLASISIAISLKRIADVLPKVSQPIAEQIVVGLRTPLNSYGEGIGEAIQGQLVRGAAGIDQYER